MTRKRAHSEEGGEEVEALETDAPLPSPVELAKKGIADVEGADVVLDEDGLLIYSINGKGLLSREPGGPMYHMLCDVPTLGVKTGDRKSCCEPLDEQCGITVKEYAAELAKEQG